jgi:sugar/nucleoside kinase (ribokinase family)
LIWLAQSRPANDDNVYLWPRKKNRMKKILGMGNALVDIMIALESDTILEMLGLPKGSMQLVDKEQSDKVLAALGNYKKSISAGGSAANTIHGLGKLGAGAGYIGVVGEDEYGGDLIASGVDPHMVHSPLETGRAVALVTPDSERTFATFLGAAVGLSADDLAPSDPASGGPMGLPALFMEYSYFHIEGYLVQNHALIRRAVELAKENGLIVSLDLASYNVVETNRDFLLSIIRDYVDIVFANEEEAKALTGHEPEKALDEIASMVKIAVVKTGSKGSLVKQDGEIFRIGVIPVTPVDTTGAGDLYAAGFLYGHSKGMPLQRCGELGALLSGNVIECMGAKMDSARWQRILAEINSI